MSSTVDMTTLDAPKKALPSWTNYYLTPYLSLRSSNTEGEFRVAAHPVVVANCNALSSQKLPLRLPLLPSWIALTPFPAAHRTNFWRNPRWNDTSNPSAPNNRDRSGEHLERIWATSNGPFLRKVEETSKIAILGHFCGPILTFKTPYSLHQHPRWPYLLEKGGRSAERLQTWGLKIWYFFQKML